MGSERTSSVPPESVTFLDDVHSYTITVSSTGPLGLLKVKVNGCSLYEAPGLPAFLPADTVVPGQGLDVGTNFFGWIRDVSIK